MFETLGRLGPVVDSTGCVSGEGRLTSPDVSRGWWSGNRYDPGDRPYKEEEQGTIKNEVKD